MKIGSPLIAPVTPVLKPGDRPEHKTTAERVEEVRNAQVTRAALYSTVAAIAVLETPEGLRVAHLAALQAYKKVQDL